MNEKKQTFIHRQSDSEYFAPGEAIFSFVFAQNFHLESKGTTESLSINSMLEYCRDAAIAGFLQRISVRNRGVVRFADETLLPIVIGSDGEQMALFEFVDEIDACLDYDLVKERLPWLSRGQISCTIGFLRGVSTFNMGHLDPDVMDGDHEALPEFQAKIKASLEGETFVYTFG